MKKTQWLIFTVLMGLMPIISKLFIIISLSNKQWDVLFNEVDFATFGLILSVTNLNELQNKIFEDDTKWRMWRIGISISLIIIFAVIFALSSLADLYATSNEGDNFFDVNGLRISAIFLSFCTLIFSYSIYHKVNTVEK